MLAQAYNEAYFKNLLRSLNFLLRCWHLKLGHLRYGVVASKHRQADAHRAIAQTRACLEHGGVADAGTWHKALHMHAGRDEDLLVACGLNHRGLNVVERTLTRVVDLENHLAQLATTYHIVLVVIYHARVPYIYMRHVCHALC